MPKRLTQFIALFVPLFHIPALRVNVVRSVVDFLAELEHVLAIFVDLLDRLQLGFALLHQRVLQTSRPGVKHHLPAYRYPSDVFVLELVPNITLFPVELCFVLFLQVGDEVNVVPHIVLKFHMVEEHVL